MLGAAAAALPVAVQAAQPRSATYRVLDLFSMIHSNNGALQDTHVTWSHHHTDSQPCSLTYTVRVRETVDMTAPVRPPAVITFRDGSSRQTDIWVPAKVTKTAQTTLDPQSYQYMTPGCPFGSGGGGSPTNDGGCGTVSGREDLQLMWTGDVLHIRGRFVSPLGSRLFRLCRPNVPPEVENGQLMETAWRLPRSLVFGNQSTIETDTTADGRLGAAVHEWAVPNAQASTVSAIWMFLRRYYPAG